ncbi:MAG: hypothetical protein R3350_03705, partial [Saprospiraceae bacterium]|nr:hypothetical protein [Saprospiraceae bacterium]
MKLLPSFGGILLFLFLNLSIVRADTYYVLFDDSCMDQLVYGYQNAPAGSNYLVYHLSVNPGEKALLDVGQVTKTYRQGLPAGTLLCGDQRLNRQLVQEMVRGQHEVFVLVAEPGNRYQVSRVNSVGYYNHSPHGI